MNELPRVFQESFARELVAASTIPKQDLRIARINVLTDQLAARGLVRPRNDDSRSHEWARARALHAWQAEV